MKIMLCLLLVEIIVYKYTHKLIFIDLLKHFWVYLVTVCNTKSYQVYPKKLYMFMYLNFFFTITFHHRLAVGL